ncbi:MAG: hypothetical protein R2749_16365 [Acidimicrobiales bacterium]
MDGWEAWGLTTAFRPRRARNGPGVERVGRGLYRIGPRPDGDLGWWQDAAIACARHPDAVLHGQAAAAALELDGFEPGVPITVAVPPAASGRGNVRRLVELAPPVTVHGLPVSSAGQTLVDLGAGLTPRPGCAAAAEPLAAIDLVELALECALRRGLTDLEVLDALLRRASRSRPGRSVLTAALRRRPADAPPTESYLETRVVQQLRSAGLPTFDRQIALHDADGFIGRVDLFLDPVVIEVVGMRWHLDRFDADHDRYGRLANAGYHVIPLTFRHIERQPGHVARKVRLALAQLR